MQYSFTTKNNYFQVIENPSEPLLNIMCLYLTTIVIRAITASDLYSMESEVDWLSALSSAADAFANTSE